MQNNNIKFCYLARLDKQLSPGIAKKIYQTVTALNKIGHQAEAAIIHPHPKPRSILIAIKTILTSKATHIIVRSDIFMPALTPVLAFRRFCGTKIIIDVPTPYSTVLNELELIENKKTIKKILTKAYLRIFFPWSWLPANKVIQYGQESWYYSLGFKNKILLTANGIDVPSIPKKSPPPLWPQRKFVMIAVGALAEWHGFDRIIKGIAQFLKDEKNSHIDPQLIIVGEGPIRTEWEQLSLNLGTNNNVQFVGLKTGRELDNIFNNAHIAISSLGLHKINLHLASVLKAREYTARGIPFIASGTDIDFQPTPSFRLTVPNDDSTVNIQKIIRWYEELEYNDSKADVTRSYASQYLDFEAKVKEFVI